VLPITEDGGIIHHQTSNVYAVLQIHSLSKLALGPDPNLLGLDFFALECRLVLGYAYPAYDCYKTLELNTPQMEQLRFWCQYWYANLSSIQIYLQNYVVLHVNSSAESEFESEFRTAHCRRRTGFWSRS